MSCISVANKEPARQQNTAIKREISPSPEPEFYLNPPKKHHPNPPSPLEEDSSQNPFVFDMSAPSPTQSQDKLTPLEPLLLPPGRFRLASLVSEDMLPKLPTTPSTGRVLFEDINDVSDSEFEREISPGGTPVAKLRFYPHFSNGLFPPSAMKRTNITDSSSDLSQGYVDSSIGSSINTTHYLDSSTSSHDIARDDLSLSVGVSAFSSDEDSPEPFTPQNKRRPLTFNSETNRTFTRSPEQAINMSNISEIPDLSIDPSSSVSHEETEPSTPRTPPSRNRSFSGPQLPPISPTSSPGMTPHKQPDRARQSPFCKASPYRSPVPHQSSLTPQPSPGTAVENLRQSFASNLMLGIPAFPPALSPIQKRHHNTPPVTPDLEAFVRSGKLREKVRSPLTVQYVPPTPERKGVLRRMRLGTAEPQDSLMENRLLVSFIQTPPVPEGQALFHSQFIERTLVGQGSSFEVYSSRWRHDGKVYAVKRRKKPFRGKKDREIQLQEVELVRRIGDHPHVVSYQQCWQEGGHFFVQMELCEANLSERALDIEGPYPPALLLDSLEQIAEGLKACHQIGILHSDVKPENILVASDGTLRLGDFGQALDIQAACANAHERWSDGVEGDAQYMAPEFLGNKSKPTVAVDIFSLGLCAFELASRQQLPTHGDVWRALRDGHAQQYIRGHVPDCMEGLILSMLNPEPRLRPNASQVISQVQSLRRKQNLSRSYSRSSSLNTSLHVPSPTVPIKIVYDNRPVAMSARRHRPQVTHRNVNRKLALTPAAPSGRPPPSSSYNYNIAPMSITGRLRFD